MAETTSRAQQVPSNRLSPARKQCRLALRRWQLYLMLLLPLIYIIIFNYIPMFGIQLAFLITGASIVEIVFAWPGLGSFMMTAISRRDYPLLMGIYLIMSICVAVMMIVVDVLYSVLDPRISHETEH